MRIPVSTYRIQFHAGFRFVDARDLVPFLQDLGITDLYSSPRFKARRGSSHGYDVADPYRINSELGTEQDFDELAEKLKHYGMGLLLDIVPNHMAASSENPWWLDVLENGPSSPYADFFDIDWHPATTKAAFLQECRVLLPILGTLYGTALTGQEFTLKIDDEGIFARIYESRLPIDPKTYLPILEDAAPQIEDEESVLAEMRDLVAAVNALPDRNDPDPERIRTRRTQARHIKQTLWRLYRAQPAVKKRIDETLWAFSGLQGDERSFDRLDNLLSQQAYRVAYWKIGYEEINYRRFFDINELIGMRIEHPEAFEARHRNSFELMAEGKVTGLRIDHVDGLNDPLGYLRRLHGGAPDRPAAGPQTYVVVEKILGRDEPLPEDWPVAGTTGYDFLNVVNGLQIPAGGFRALENTYAHFTSSRVSFAETCYARNKQVMQTLFPGEVNALGHHLGRLAARHREARDVPLSDLVQALVEVTACLPVYRTYIRDFTIAARDRQYIEDTVQLARSRVAEDRISSQAFDFLSTVLLLDPPFYLDAERGEWLRFVMRWQQFTGPVMAKGLEDTASYTHNSLISVNEVGSDPVRDEPPYDVADFHRFNLLRYEKWRHTMNATATHDTKRGEDTRARLNVLAEMAEVWEQKLYRWSAQNENKKQFVAGWPAPAPGEEALLYQTLIGAWPLDEADLAGFADRIREFVIKAAREAKTFTSWIRTNEAHEQALLHFTSALLEPENNPFLEDLTAFIQEIAPHGAVNSLSQTLLKIGSPGVPDFYQGTELWSFTLVDPDNRRPVDYKKRTGYLEYLRRRESEDLPELLRDLTSQWRAGGIKLYLTYKALEFRRLRRDLFLEGSYVPVEAAGERAQHVVAFLRRHGSEAALIVAPRWPKLLGGNLLSGEGDWRDTCLSLPRDVPAGWKNVLTGSEVNNFALAGLLRDFPVALLEAA